MLTTNPSYTPGGDLTQSDCDVSSGQDPCPPGLVACTPSSSPLLQNGGFEDQVTPIWTVPNPEGTNISSYNAHTGNLGLRMVTNSEGSGIKRPYTWQQFTMGDWITNTSTLKLSLWKSVDSAEGDEVTDTLKVVLRTTEAVPTVVSTPTIIARGDQGAGFPDNYFSGEWDLLPAMRALGNNPASFVGQNLQLYIYDDSNAPDCLNFGPNCFWTEFYVDDVSLELCTTQPVPAADPDKATIKGAVRVWINGIPVRKQGVRVWTYRQNGAMYTTYSIQDSTYGFYLMEPGDYVLYAEWWEGADLYTAMTGVRAVAGTTTTKALDLY